MIIRNATLGTMIDVFQQLAKTGITFTCIFRKLDGSTRLINARTLGDVQYNRKKRESYVNVIDLDLPTGQNNDRKIVLQRVRAVTIEDYTFTS